MKSIGKYLGVHLGALAIALSTAAIAQDAMTEAQVRKVDIQARKITLAHGEIKNLDMPPMTMVFEVKPGVAIDKVKAGDKVRFLAGKTDGKYTVMELEMIQVKPQ